MKRVQLHVLWLCLVVGGGWASNPASGEQSPASQPGFPSFPVVISTHGAVSDPAAVPAPAEAAAAASVPAAAASVPGEAVPTPAAAAPVPEEAVPTPAQTAPAPEPVASAAVPPGSLEVARAIAGPAVYAPVTKPVSLDLKDMDVVEVVKMLCKQNGINVVVDRNVSGRVTLLLNNVEFWEAMKAILNSRDLAYAREGNLVEVMSAPDFERVYGVPFSKKTQRLVLPLRHAKAKTAKEMLESIKSKIGSIAVDEVTNSLIIDDNPGDLAEMRQRVETFDVPEEMQIFRLNYATADELEPKISPLVSKDFGSLQIDKRSNTLVVRDNAARMKDITELIKAFDVRHRCVLIEAKIMQVILNKSFQSGVNWQGIDWTHIMNNLNGYHLAGTMVQNLQLVPPTSLTPGNITAPGITASVGILEKPDFRTVINLLGSIGTTKLLSSPRIMALNNQEAKIHVGSKAAKITKTVLNVGSTTSNPVTTENVEFLDTGVKLSVTPSVGDDGIVTLKVKPEVSSVESTITTSEGSSIPIIRTSAAEASLVVKDGVTVVIGGLIEEVRAKTDTEVPWFGRIPVIGMLFRSRAKTEQKTELVIFLTPHIVTGDQFSPEVQTRLEVQPDGTPKKKGFFRRLFGKKSPAL